MRAAATTAAERQARADDLGQTEESEQQQKLPAPIGEWRVHRPAEQPLHGAIAVTEECGHRVIVKIDRLMLMEHDPSEADHECRQRPYRRTGDLLC